MMSSRIGRTAGAVVLWQAAMLVDRSDGRRRHDAVRQEPWRRGERAGRRPVPRRGRPDDAARHWPRDVNGGLVLVLLVVVLGGFVFAQASVKEVIVQLWHSLVA